MNNILPNEFPVTLTMNGEVYDEEHDADGGCWQVAEMPHGWDELVEFIHRQP